MKLTALVIAIALALTVTTLAAQAPWRAEFTPSPEHNAVEQGLPVISSYGLVVYAPGATAPVGPELNIGKPTPNALNVISVDVNATMTALPASPNCNTAVAINPAPPFSPTCYVAKVIARGPGGFAESAPSLPFTLVPRAPTAAGQPAIKR